MKIIKLCRGGIHLFTCNKGGLFKKVLALTLVSTALLGLTSCGNNSDDPLMSQSKQSLVDMINSTNEELVSCYEQIDELNNLLTSVSEEKGPTSAITEMSDGTGRKTFNTVDGQFSLPVDFKYPGSQQAPNTSSINISEAVSIIPTSNWDCKLVGTTLELSHSSGIAGTISIGLLDREAQKTQASELQGYLDEMLASLPIDSKKPSSLFVNDTLFGVDNVSHTFIDEEDAMIRCGILGFSDISVQYFFVYKGKQDSAKDEVILSLIKTMKIWNSNLSVE